MIEALAGFGAFMALTLVRIPLAFAMLIVGFVGFGLKVNFAAAASMIGMTMYETGLSYTLSVIPLFILMGNFVVRAGLATELFDCAYRFIGAKRGGLAMATIISCAAFGAVCGSSIATSATFSKVAYPSMNRFNYSDGFAASVIAAGGTLGILIPPSTVMIIYGIMTETSIAKLFMAGVIPGTLAVIFLCLTVVIITRLNVRAAPAGSESNWHERLLALAKVWPVIALFVLVMGGIYGGFFTATEAAGIGAAGGLAFAIQRRALSRQVFFKVLIESARTTAMLFLIVIGALVFANFMNYTSISTDLGNLISTYGLKPIHTVLIICAIYIILGTVMEELSMMLLTLPIFFPLVVGLGYDPVWFGILIIIVVQVGMISPPVGMNIFVVRSILTHVPVVDMFRNIWPFNLTLIVLGLMIIIFPQIALWLPGFVK